MLSYEEFKDYVKDHIREHLPESLEDSFVSLHDVMKNNGLVRTGIVISASDNNAAPTIYLDELYKQYERTEELEGILDEIARIAENHQAPMSINSIAKEFMNFDAIKDRIIMVVVNADLNRELLEKAPHKLMVGDLAAIYKVRFNMDEEGVGTCTILRQHMKHWDVTDEELHEIAITNSKEILPAKVGSMAETFAEIMGYDSIEEAMEEHKEMFEATENSMYVITNVDKTNGAGVIFYDDGVFEKLTNKLGDKICILPSSTHEVIAVRADSMDVESMESMVREINENEVELTERLSDHVYMYDAMTKEITLANEEARQAMVSEDNNKYQSEDAVITRPRRSR